MDDKNQANAGEVVNNNPNNVKEEGVGNTILSTLSKTLISLIVIVGYLLALLIQLCPLQAIKVYEYIGASNIAIVAYENQYKKTRELTDLYNLIQKSISNKDYGRTVNYIEVLQEDKEYTDFCTSVNSSSVKAASLDRIAFVADLDSYLISQKVNAYYYINQTKALDIALEDLFNTDNIYSVGLTTYISLLINDKGLTEEQKNAKFEQIKSSINQETNVLERIDYRLTLVDVDILNPTSDVDKILMTYTSLKLNQAKYNIYKFTNEQTLANNVLVEINRLQDVYDDLIK